MEKTHHLPCTRKHSSSVGGRERNCRKVGIIGSTSHGLVTDGTWKCSSDLPVGWNSPDFDDQDCPLAKVVGINGDHPWGKIHGIAEMAKWIWADNNKDVVYCRLKLK